MKKKFITLGALAIMLAFSSVEVKANDSSSSTTPETITQEYSVNRVLNKLDFQEKMLLLLSDFSGVDKAYLDENCNVCSFASIGLDSLDWIEFGMILEDEYNIYGELSTYWYDKPLYEFINNYLWKRYCQCN